MPRFVAAAWQVGLAIALAGAGVVAPAAAADASAAQPAMAAVAGPGLSVHRLAAHYHAVEWRDDGAVFNDERGWLHGAGLGLDWPVARTAHGAWRLQLWLAELEGDVAYQGQTQFGMPLRTRSDLLRQELQVLALLQGTAPPPLPWRAGWWLGPGLQGVRQARGIRRTVLSSALDERLDSWRLALQAGVELAVPVAGHALRLSASVQASRPWRQTLAVDGGPAFDPVQLAPARTLSYQATLALDMALHGGWQAGFSWRQQRESPGASAVAVVRRGPLPVGAVRFPGSQYRLQHWGLALTRAM